MRLFSKPGILAPVAAVALAGTVLVVGSVVSACPFCTAQALTLTEEINTAQVAVLATLAKVPDSNQQPVDPSASLDPCEFTIDKVIKGEKDIEGQKVVKTLYFGQAPKGTQFLITAIPSEQSKILWAAPIALPPRGIDYLATVLKLPEKGPDRLLFFVGHVQDKDDLIARDAYDEIAKTAYEDIRAAKEKLPRTDLVKWVQDPETTASKRRMFFSLLSVCGTKEEVPMLEKMIRSTDRRDRSGLDSLLNCYMALRGEDAMPLIEELFLKDPKVDYTDRYSAIMAIRFQGTDGKAVPRERLVKSLRLNLDHPKVADLVVMDLARWGDWESMDRLVEMFRKSNDETIFIREPVINYLRICPDPAAKKHLEELAKIDPIAYQRALSMMHLPAVKKDQPADDKATAKPGEKPKEDQSKNAEKPTSSKPDSANGDQPAAAQPTPPTSGATSPASNRKLGPRVAKRPTIALTGVESTQERAIAIPGVNKGDHLRLAAAESKSAPTASPGTIAVAVVFVASAIGGAVVSVRHKAAT